MLKKTRHNPTQLNFNFDQTNSIFTYNKPELIYFSHHLEKRKQTNRLHEKEKINQIITSCAKKLNW